MSISVPEIAPPRASLLLLMQSLLMTLITLLAMRFGVPLGIEHRLGQGDDAHDADKDDQMDELEQKRTHSVQGVKGHRGDEANEHD